MFDPWIGKNPWRRKLLKKFLHAIFLHENFFLPENSHGEWILVDYSPKGCKELDVTEQLSMENDSYLQINSLCVYCLQDFVLGTLHILPFKSLVLLLIGEKGNAKEMLWCSRKCLGFATFKCWLSILIVCVTLNKLPNLWVSMSSSIKYESNA